MVNEKLTQILKLAASSENTTELKMYWEKRYEEMFSRNLFSLSSKTIDIITQKEILTKPTTPFGDIILLSHLDKNQTLEETTLQSTVETAVRFLDGLLDGINFNADAKNIINQYRKIGIGITDFKQYLDKLKTVSDLDEIDHIGNLISSNSYRASESLAEEKGVCQAWDKIKHHLRPKSFEYWYDSETGEIKNGLEMSEIYTLDSVKNTKYEIIPRRNSNILLFPPDLEWQIWTDRDTSAPITENVEPVKMDIATTQIPETVNNLTFSQSDAGLDKIETSDKANPVLSDPPNLESTSHLQEPVVYEETKDMVEDVFKANHQDQSEIDEVFETEQQNSAVQPEFQVGELVKIVAENTDDSNKIYQVIDTFRNQDDNGFQYKLTGGHSGLESKTWEEKDLTQVQLGDILDKINSPVVEKKPDVIQSNLQMVSAIIIQNDQILVEKNEENYTLPTGIYNTGELPEHSLQHILYDKFGITGNVVYEIGTALNINNDQDSTNIHFGFVVEIQQNIGNGLTWLPLSDKYRLDSVSNTLLTKFDQQKTYLHKLDGFMKDASEGDLFDRSNKITTKYSQTKSKETIKQQKNYLTPNFMSQYTLKLEQFIQTNVFGNLSVVLQYDGTGNLKLINMNGESMTPDLKHTLDSILNLVNFILINKISPIDLAHQLDVEPKDGMHLPINDLLTVISSSLKQAPSNISEITPQILADIDTTSPTHPLQSNFETYHAIEEHTKPATSSGIPDIDDADDNRQTRGFFGQFGN